MINCKICGNSYKGTNALCVHLRKTHDMNAKTYYDKFYKTTEEGFCLLCGNPTKFANLIKGYNLYCSTFCANQSPYRVESIRHTMNEKYGVFNAFQLSEVREKCEKAANSPEAREKAKQTSLKHYGVDNPAKSAVVQEKSRQTCLDRYGVEYSFQSEEVREKSKETMQKRYGVEHNSQIEQNKRRFAISSHTTKVEKKRHDTRKATGWLKNKVEKYFLSKIDNAISYKHNYKSALYPYKCDFYFPEFDLYVEINNYWAHGKHFYDNSDKQDVELLEKWKNKTKQSKDQYAQAIKTWLGDLDKRDCAMKNNLNYVVLWNYEHIDKFFELFPNFTGFVDFNNL